MATHTTYYNLTKPAQNDKVNIGVLNDNADIIDTALHNKVDSDQLTADNVMMSDGVTSVKDALDNIYLKHTEVTLPFTPPRDGLIIASIRGGSTSGDSYITYNGAIPNIINDNIHANGYYNGVLCVSANTEVSVASSGNISSAVDAQKYYYITIDTI